MTVRPNEIYRNACRRSHRILGSYLALLAWKKEVDCVIVAQDELFDYLGIKAMRKQRLRWLVHDIKDLFPHAQALYRSTRGHVSTYLSRLKFPAGAFDERMYDDERVHVLREGGLRTVDISLPSEDRMAAFLAFTAIGVGQG